MVKNNKGGKRGKKQARKNVKTDGDSTRHTRLTNKAVEDEMYAIVEKHYGGEFVGVRCNDGKERKCVIRRKFRHRNKNQNFVRVGSRVLVGLRSWESSATGKDEKCDLLHVYFDNEINELRKDPTFNYLLLKGITTEDNKEKAKEDDEFDFVLEYEEEEKEEVDIDDI